MSHQIFLSMKNVYGPLVELGEGHRSNLCRTGGVCSLFSLIVCLLDIIHICFLSVGECDTYLTLSYIYKCQSCVCCLYVSVYNLFLCYFSQLDQLCVLGLSQEKSSGAQEVMYLVCLAETLSLE